jgi:HEPN domain-containing protein
MPHDNNWDDAQAWIRYAEADMALAEAPLPAKGMFEHLCFHCQKAAEKAIKAVLVSQGIMVPKTHNIELLLTLLSPGSSRENLPANAYRLTAYATIFRYPGEEEPVSSEDYLTLLMIARHTLAWAIAVMNDHHST